MSWSLTINEKINEAIESGELEFPEQLKGEKLDLEAYFSTPEELRQGYAVLAGAGFSPMEVDLLKERKRLTDALKSEKDETRISEFHMLLNAVNAKLNLKSTALGSDAQSAP